jgi:hypothetical protein
MIMLNQVGKPAHSDVIALCTNLPKKVVRVTALRPTIRRPASSMTNH